MRDTLKIIAVTQSVKRGRGATLQLSCIGTAQCAAIA